LVADPGSFVRLSRRRFLNGSIATSLNFPLVTDPIVEGKRVLYSERRESHRAVQQAAPSAFSCSSVRQTRLRRAGKHRKTHNAINRKGACSSNHEQSDNRKYQQVKLISLALLSAGPIHEKAEGTVLNHYCHQHVHTDSERCDSGQESEDESDPAEELGRDG
jgi:hypothetical protein